MDTGHVEDSLFGIQSLCDDDEYSACSQLISDTKLQLEDHDIMNDFQDF